MHLINLLNKYDITQEEKKLATTYFENRTVSSSSVENFIQNLR